MANIEDNIHGTNFSGSRINTKAYEEAMRKLREGSHSIDWDKLYEASERMGTQPGYMKPQQKIIYVVSDSNFNYFLQIEGKIKDIEPRFKLQFVTCIDSLMEHNAINIWTILRTEWSVEFKYEFNYYSRYRQGNTIRDVPKFDIDLYDFVKLQSREIFGSQESEYAERIRQSERWERGPFMDNLDRTIDRGASIKRKRACPNKEQHEAYEEYQRILAENKIGEADLIEKICKIFDIKPDDLFVHAQCGKEIEHKSKYQDEMNVGDWKNIVNNGIISPIPPFKPFNDPMV